MSTPNESAPVIATPPSPPAMVGGPGDPIVPQTPPAAPTTDETRKVFKLGSRVFDSVEEASNYVAGLETTPKAPEPQQIIPQAPVTGVDLIDGRPLIDVLLEDPDKVVQHTIQKTLQVVDARAKQKAESDRLWSVFYSKYPDLRGKDRVVKPILAENAKAWDKLTEEDGMKMLAQTARDEIKSMGLEPGTVTELPTREANTLGASRGEGSLAPITTVKAPLNMYEQMKVMQAKRKAAQVK